MRTQSNSSSRSLLALGVIASWSVLGCAAGGGSLAASDALHAELETCPDATAVGVPCDASLADCASATDFAVACRCDAADGTARVRCDPPLPVPALLICADDVGPGTACDGASTDSACVLPRGGRCVCREATSDPRVPAGAIYEWACEVPPPLPRRCDATVSAGGACAGLEGSICELGGASSCTCTSTSAPTSDGTIDGTRGDARWACAAEPTVIPPCSSATGTCAEAPECLLDDGRHCRCIESSADGGSRYECGPPPPPPASYCPRGVAPGSTDRVECDAIGTSCSVAGSTTDDHCRCVEDTLRDPARLVGVWECASTAVSASAA